MKIAIIVTTLIINLAIAEDNCELRCSNLKLESDVPIDLRGLTNLQRDSNCYAPDCFNTTFQKLHLYDASGFIDEKTFSLMPQLEVLELQSDWLDEVERGVICKTLPNLKNLELQFTGTLSISTESFIDNCLSLKKLSVVHGAVDKDTLRTVPNLEDLAISYQLLVQFSKEYLKSLEKLKALKLSSNKINVLDDGAFCQSPQIELLSLVDNEILSPITKETFENCGNVTNFKFMYNKATLADGAFSALTNVKVASLNYLKVHHLTKGSLEGLSNVEKLTLIESDIRSIDADAFSDFTQLKDLSLTSNELSVIDSDLIKSLPNIVRLELSHNRFSKVENIIHPTLETLLVNTNCISNVSETALKENLPNLKELDLSCNMISADTGEYLKKKLAGISTYFTRYPYDKRDCRSRNCPDDFSFLIPL